jgi:hypothetical protein
MGDAKRRGTYEERVKQAKERQERERDERVKMPMVVGREERTIFTPTPAVLELLGIYGSVAFNVNKFNKRS